MEKAKKDLEELWRRYVEERITPDELNELLSSLQDVTREPEHVSWAQQAAMNAGSGLPEDPEQEEQVWQQLLQQTNSFNRSTHLSSARVVHRVHFIRRWWAAAVILLLLSTGIYIFIHKKSDTVIIAGTSSKKSIPINREGAFLTLADGSRILLDTIKNGVVALQNGVTARIKNGLLVYEGNSENEVYNSIATPRGRQYHLVLPDGTGVWLNAASSISYPIVFRGATRNVTVTGEVYFDVARNTKAPFIVTLNDYSYIEVLGTQFNINTYEDEAGITATLLEGSVKVSSTASSSKQSAVVLKPGQQAHIDQQPGITVVNDPDLEKIIAWKNGYFNFSGTSVKEAMLQIERWYDIEVVYKTGIPSLQFFGEISRNARLSEVLDMLAGAKLKFRMEENEKKLIIL